jgi:hypothetical protein
MRAPALEESGMASINGVSGAGHTSYSGEVLRMQNDDAKLQGANAAKLIDSAADVSKQAQQMRHDGDPSVGSKLDLRA